MKSSYSFMYRLINIVEHKDYTEHRMSCVEHELTLDLYSQLRLECVLTNCFAWMEFKYYNMHVGVRRVNSYELLKKYL